MACEKKCSKCFTIKPISNFSRAKDGLYGRRANCKACQVAINKEYRHNKKANTEDSICWKCSNKLDPVRYKLEQKRMKREGFGAKLPLCFDCAGII